MKTETTAVPIYGLENLIAGVTPAYSGWTVDPTDGANITDGNIATICTTGNKVCGGAWQYAYFEWDLGDFYNVFISGVGGSTTTAGNLYTYIRFWDGGAWRSPTERTAGGLLNIYEVSGCLCSKVRIGIGASAAATITPNIREFHVWRIA